MIIIDYILGSLFRIGFILSLLIFHPIQIVAYNLLGPAVHQKVAQWLNGAFILCFKVAGTRVRFNEKYQPPTNHPIIFVANHQSMWDIVGIYWYLRKYKPIFVSKLELSKGIPSISYNLRKSNAALINRKDKKQAIIEILRLGRHIQAEKKSAVIFPEGTRSRNKIPKEFAYGGLVALKKKAPLALIVPIAIKGTGAIEASKRYRIHAFKSISWTVLPPVNSHQMNPEELASHLRERISEELSIP